MVTMVTGSHAIGGYRALSSPGLTTCPYVPFDCTTAGQLSAAPFDNDVFKVACDGVDGVSKGVCEWNVKCSNPSVDQPDCPFTGAARAGFAACNATSYPAPGLISGEFVGRGWGSVASGCAQSHLPRWLVLRALWSSMAQEFLWRICIVKACMWMECGVLLTTSAQQGLLADAISRTLMSTLSLGCSAADR
jgi:hypothetical protein